MKVLMIIMAAMLLAGCSMSYEDIQKKKQECAAKGEMGFVIRAGGTWVIGVGCIALPKPAAAPEVKVVAPEIKPVPKIDITGVWENYDGTIMWEFRDGGVLDVIKNLPDRKSMKSKKKKKEFSVLYFEVTSWKGYHIAGTTDSSKIVPVTNDILEITPGKDGVVTYFYRGHILNHLTEGQVLADLVKLIREDELWELEHLNKVGK